MLRRLNHYEDAIESYERALALEPEHAWAWNGLSMCQTALGRFAEAAESSDKAVKYDPNDLWYWINYSDALENMDDLPGAEDKILHALELEPDHEQALRRLERIRKKMNS